MGTFLKALVMLNSNFLILKKVASKLKKLQRYKKFRNFRVTVVFVVGPNIIRIQACGYFSESSLSAESNYNNFNVSIVEFTKKQEKILHQPQKSPTRLALTWRNKVSSHISDDSSHFCHKNTFWDSVHTGMGRRRFGVGDIGLPDGILFPFRCKTAQFSQEDRYEGIDGIGGSGGRAARVSAKKMQKSEILFSK